MHKSWTTTEVSQSPHYLARSWNSYVYREVWKSTSMSSPIHFSVASPRSDCQQWQVYSWLGIWLRLKPLFVASLNVRKAWSTRVPWKRNVTSQTWISGCGILSSLYSGSTKAVCWNSIDSRLYVIQKGVKQDGILSPYLYKVYINDLLQSLHCHQIGIKIGSTFLGVPTCVDDELLILCYPFQLQTMLDISYSYSCEDQYQVHSQKSVTIQLVPLKVYLDFTCKLGNQKVASADQFTHLGLFGSLVSPLLI